MKKETAFIQQINNATAIRLCNNEGYFFSGFAEAKKQPTNNDNVILYLESGVQRSYAGTLTIDLNEIEFIPTIPATYFYKSYELWVA